MFCGTDDKITRRNAQILEIFAKAYDQNLHDGKNGMSSVLHQISVSYHVYVSRKSILTFT